MDYVAPNELLTTALAAASKKAELSVRDMLIRGFLAGAILAYATSLVFIVNAQGLAPVVGAILFGFPPNRTMLAPSRQCAIIRISPSAGSSVSRLRFPPAIPAPQPPRPNSRV